MVNVATPSKERLSTKALAAGGQFRAIALWLNEPLIPQGIYVQVRKDKRQGCILIVAEFERPPEPQRLTQYICHLIWQLNSPLIEGIHLMARPVGESRLAWERRVRIMTPALREQLNRFKGKGGPVSSTSMPPAIAQKPPSPNQPSPQRLFTEQLKTLRAFMLTGSAVAAFVFGCLVEILLSAGQGPSLPFENRQTSQQQPVEVQIPESQPLTSPQLPNIKTVLADYEPDPASHEAEAMPVSQTPSAHEATPVYHVPTDRPNYVHGALEPVGVMAHERLPNPADPTVTLVFGGDVSLDNLPYSNYEDDQQLLAGVPVYQQADVAMVNLDDSLATADTSLEEKFLERQRPDAINLLKAGGVDIINLSSQHTLDFGENGLAETLDVLDSSGIYRVGAGRNEREARRPEILDVKGQRIAYLSYDQTGEHSAYGSFAGVNVLDKQTVIEDIGAIRDEVDWLVVNFRWTEEIPEKAADFQTNLARLAVDKGADLVVGHHPTQLQGAEIYKGRPIAYSLGDFVFGKLTEETTAASAMLQVSLSDRQMKVDLIPVKVEAGQPQRVQGTEAANILNKIRTASQDFESPMDTSVVLDARPLVLLQPDESQKDNPFVEGSQAESDGSSQPEEKTPQELLLNVPLEADDVPPINMEPIPDELLNNWGPKQGAGTLYKPESTLPSDSRLFSIPSPEAEAKPQVSTESGVSEEAEPDLSKADEPESAPKPSSPLDADVMPSDGAIKPYSEPLVGPLSVLPAESPAIAVEAEVVPESESPTVEPSGGAVQAEGEQEAIPTEDPAIAVAAEVVPEELEWETTPEDTLQEVASAEIPLLAQQQLGLPQSRIFKPLHESKTTELNTDPNAEVIDVEKLSVRTESDHP
ncbi:MAG: CapA family protein [Cyanobacteria bacterium P01_F01_bin.86]